MRSNSLCPVSQALRYCPPRRVSVDDNLAPVKAVSEGSSKMVVQYIFERLPSDADGFEASLGHQVLSRLSYSLTRLPYPSGQRPDHLNDHRRNIELAPTLLENLSKLLREGYFDGGRTEGKANKKNAQRGKTQLSKAPSAAHDEINNRLFTALGRAAPRNRESAEKLVQSIIATQKEILKVRLPAPSLSTRLSQCLARFLPPLCELLKLQSWFAACTFVRMCRRVNSQFRTNKLPPRRWAQPLLPPQT